MLKAIRVYWIVLGLISSTIAFVGSANGVFLALVDDPITFVDRIFSGIVTIFLVIHWVSNGHVGLVGSLIIVASVLVAFMTDIVSVAINKLRRGRQGP